MIVRTLIAQNIPRGPMVLIECKMLKVSDGDKLHCHPDLATQLLERYKDHFKDAGHSDKPGVPAGARWHLEPVQAIAKVATVAGAAASPLAEVAQDKSMATPKNRGRAGTKEASPAST